MCPACMTTAAVIAAGTTTGGGLIGFLLKKLRRKKSLPPQAQTLSADLKRRQGKPSNYSDLVGNRHACSLFEITKERPLRTT